MLRNEYGFLYESNGKGELYLFCRCLMPCKGEGLEKHGFQVSEYYLDEWIKNPTDIILRVDGNRLRIGFKLYGSSFSPNHDIL